MRITLLLSLVVFFSANPMATPGLAAVEVSCDVHAPSGPTVRADAVGLSYETSILLPNAQGTRYFRPGRPGLTTLLQTMGVRSLRIGGNSVDEASIPLPGPDDIDAVFTSAKAIGATVIWSVRLQDGKPEDAERQAKHIYDHHRASLAQFAIGNEPYYYEKQLAADYLPRWTALRDAILRGFPGATFCGPDQNPDTRLYREVVQALAPTGSFTVLSAHLYSFGCSYTNPKDGQKAKDRDEAKAVLKPRDPVAARKAMLAPEAYKNYQALLNRCLAATKGTNIAFRLTETNSYWFSGLQGASDSVESGLWAADYLAWWTLNGAQGVNFHTGDRTGGHINLPCRYAAFVAAGEGFEVRPLAYGMTLFSQVAQGTCLPVTLDPKAPLSAYAFRRDANSLGLLIINRSDRDAAPQDVTLRVAGANVTAAQNLLLESRPEGTPAMTLGGQAIGADGTWTGTWADQPLQDGAVTLRLQPLSAAAVRLTIP